MDVGRHVPLEVIARLLTLCQSIRFQVRGLRHIQNRPHKEVNKEVGGRLRCRLVLQSQCHALLAPIVIRLVRPFQRPALEVHILRERGNRMHLHVNPVKSVRIVQRLEQVPDFCVQLEPSVLLKGDPAPRNAL